MIPLLILGLVSKAIATSFVVKNFEAKVHHGDSAHAGLWAIEITPPKHHHFNLDAPHGAKSDGLTFETVIENPQKMVFQAEDPSLKSGKSVETVAFLCDEAKTYCLKKKVMVTLDPTQAKPLHEKFKKPVSQSTGKPGSVPNQKSGSIKKAASTAADTAITNESTAVAEAVRTGKPLLIDFFGIWCPPCNLYNETIFNTADFRKRMRDFVFLKLDADAESSFALKSRFKVGGYPTLIVARAEKNGSLIELERIVGYFPLKEFLSKLDRAYAHRMDPEEKRWAGRKLERLQSLLEQKDFDGMIALAGSDTDPSVVLYRYLAQVRRNDSWLKEEQNLSDSKKMLSAIQSGSQQLASATLLHAIDFLQSEFWLKQESYRKLALELLDQLGTRKDSELTKADQWVLRMDLFDLIGDRESAVKARKKAILEYEKGNPKLRGTGLEYAALLTLDGRYDDAKKVYQQMIAKFPQEFTFYFAAAKTYLASGDLKTARTMAEKALQYSYGDNRIRAMERWVSIMGESGLKSEAVAKGQEFLKTLTVPEGLQVRTGRYVEALKKTLKKWNGETN
jgi:tetratricopeptide (TPR) repeat protein